MVPNRGPLILCHYRMKHMLANMMNMYVEFLSVLSRKDMYIHCPFGSAEG